MIKLERNLTAGLNQDSLRQELVAAEVVFAREIGAALIAQRIETKDELATLADLGVTLGQGYHLGRPSVQPREWAKWAGVPGISPPLAVAAGPLAADGREPQKGRRFG